LRFGCPRLTSRHALHKLELAQHPQLEKHWRYLQRKEAKAAKQPGHVPIAQQQQVVFLPNLVDEFLAMLPAAVTGAGAVDAAKLAYCEVRAAHALSSHAAYDEATALTRSPAPAL
jgi:hypothetical protein